MSIKEDARKAAEEMRASTWGGGFPVNPIRIASTLGVQVMEADLGDNISGALVKSKGKEPTILLNAQDAPNRKRFTCAHELGHLAKRQDDFSEFEYIDFRDGSSSTGEVESERFANAFAANLLMPEDAVREARDAGMSEYAMAQHFGASLMAVRYRLDNLGL